MSTDLAPSTGTTDLTEQMNFARAVTTEGRGQSILPDSYRDNPGNVLIAVGLGAAMGLSPAESLYRISVIKGRPTAGAELIASNVRRAGHKLRVVGDETSCTATIIRADDPDFTFEVTRDMEWAKRMGLAQNDNYRKQAGTMLQWRAITAVARLACPEALYGVTYTPDEMSDLDGGRPAPVNAGPARSSSARLADFVKPDPAPEPEPAEPATAPSEAARRKMFAVLKDAGFTDRDAILTQVSQIIGRDVASSNELDASDVSAVVDALSDEQVRP